MREQVESVLVELFESGHGFVRFEPMTLPERGEISVDATDLLVEERLHTAHGRERPASAGSGS